MSLLPVAFRYYKVASGVVIVYFTDTMASTSVQPVVSVTNLKIDAIVRAKMAVAVDQAVMETGRSKHGDTKRRRNLLRCHWAKRTHRLR